MTAKEYYDVVIVGAGISGAILANKLGQEGLHVLLLEAGDRDYFELEPTTEVGGLLGTDRRGPLLDNFYGANSRVPNAPYPSLDYAPHPFEDRLDAYYTGKAYDPGASPDKPPKFKSTFTRAVGGTTNHWLGTSLRFLPSSFAEKSRYGRGVDWPIDYGTLEPWYAAADVEIGVAGDADEDHGSPRSTPFPMPNILQSYQDKRIHDRIVAEQLSYEGIALRVQVTPQARNSVPFDGRPPCAGSSNCIPLCPIQAKYDATVHLKRALKPEMDPHKKSGALPVELVHQSVVTKVLVDRDALVSGLEYKLGARGERQIARGRMYVLAASAIENAKLLLMSEWHPGVTMANSSDTVGRYLMDHNIAISWAMVDEPLYPFRAPMSTSGIEVLRDGPFRRDRSAFRIEIQNVAANWGNNTPWKNIRDLVNQGRSGRGFRDQLAWDVARTVQLDALIEPEPQWSSTIRPSTKVNDFGVPRPEINYVIDEYTKKGEVAFKQVVTEIFRVLGVQQDNEIHFGAELQGAGHIMGTHRMGDDPRTSVTDSHGRTHDHRNLWLTGSGLFPTVDSCNPTLTIVALTLRQAEKMIQIFKKSNDTR